MGWAALHAPSSSQLQRTNFLLLLGNHHVCVCLEVDTHRDTLIHISTRLYTHAYKVEAKMAEYERGHAVTNEEHHRETTRLQRALEVSM